MKQNFLMAFLRSFASCVRSIHTCDAESLTLNSRYLEGGKFKTLKMR